MNIPKRLYRLNQAGTTLVEMLIVMGLLSIFLLILTTVFTSTVDIQAQTQSYSASISESRFILARLNYDIARASAITTPAALGDTSPSLVMTIGGVAHTYSVNAGTLQLTDAGGTANLTGSEVTISALSFQRLGGVGSKESIRYSFTVTSVAQGREGADVQTYTSTVGRRQ